MQLDLPTYPKIWRHIYECSLCNNYRQKQRSISYTTYGSSSYLQVHSIYFTALLQRGCPMTLRLIQKMTLLKMTDRQKRLLTCEAACSLKQRLWYLPTLIWLHVLFQVPIIVWKMITLKSTFMNVCLHIFFEGYIQLICKVTGDPGYGTQLTPVIPHSEKGCVSLSIDCSV